MIKKGFTLVELILAVVIGAFVTVTAVAAMRGIVSGSQTHQRMTELSDEMRYACCLIKQDLNNLYRNSEFQNSKFELSYIDNEEGISTQSLTLFTVSHKKVRPSQPEGDIYEVQYLMDTDELRQQSVLMRRCCPVVPGIAEGQDIERAGVLVPIAENITTMNIRCYNGTEWVDEWSRQNGEFPELIEVALLATGNDGKKLLKRSLVTANPRMKSNQQTMDSQQDDQTQEQPDHTSYMDDQFSGMDEQGESR